MDVISTILVDSRFQGPPPKISTEKKKGKGYEHSVYRPAYHGIIIYKRKKFMAKLRIEPRNDVTTKPSAQTKIVFSPLF